MATYGGDANFAPIASAAITQVVVPTPTATFLNVSPSPSTFGSPVDLIASVVGPLAPAGTVTFSIDGSPIATVTLVAGSVGGDSAASFTTSRLAVGSHRVTASYQGDADFAPSDSAATVQTVVPAASTILLTASPNPSTPGESVTLIATISGPIAPTGIVTFFDGTLPLELAPVGPNGRAQLVIASLGGRIA